MSFAVSTSDRTSPICLFLIKVSSYLLWIFYRCAEARGLESLYLASSLCQQYLWVSHCARPAARGLRELTHLAPAAFFPLPSYPICCLHVFRGSFRRVFYHRLGLHPVPFIPSRLRGMALEPFHCRGVRRFVDIGRCFRFRSDKCHQRNWSGG